MNEQTSEIMRLQALADVRKSPGYALLLEEIDKLRQAAESSMETSGNDIHGKALAASSYLCYQKCIRVINTATESAGERLQSIFRANPDLMVRSMVARAPGNQDCNS